MSVIPASASLSMVPEDLLPSAWTGHVPFAFWLVEALRPAILVELGTHNGTSFLAFCQAIKAQGVPGKAFAVDTWQGDEQAGHYGDEVHDRLEAVVVAKYAGFAQLMRMRFDEAAPYFSEGSIDLLHIDGLHTYEAVRHDFETWLPKLSRRGVVIFHDTMVREREFGVWKLWEALRDRYPSFEFRHTHGLGVLLVGDQPPASLLALAAASGTPEGAVVSDLFHALGQRFGLLERIAQVEARSAEAVQHAANYKLMFENADAGLRRAMDSLAAQLESQRQEVGSAAAQITRLMAACDAMRTEVRVSLSVARERLGLAASAKDAAEPAQAFAAFLEDLRSQLEQQAADAQARHAADLAAARTRFEQDLASARAESRAAAAAAQADHQAALAALRADLRERESRLRDLRAQLDLREREVRQLVSSKSWRITTPMRWLRGAWTALAKGGPLPGYAAMRGLPGLDGRRDDEARPASSEPAPAGATADYLRDLFADAPSRRAPGYLGPESAPASPPARVRAKAIAFYLPQFHVFPENEAWWGPGFTEWTNATRAVPQFVGHEQPQLPSDLGFYDLRVPGVMQRQVALARLYGIHAFCFHYYWFAGKRLMEAPLESLLAQPSIDFPFCLCWANENWTRRWDGRDDEVLISQEHGPENDLAFIRDLERYLRDPRYLRIDGRPLVVVYRASLLPDAAATVARWREHCRQAGIGEIFVAMVQFDAEDPRPFGFDAAMEFPPHKLANGFERINDTLDIINPGYRGSVFHYQSIVDSAKAWPERGFPLVRGVFPGWDNEARRPGKGYTFAFSTPERYRAWLAASVAYAEQHPVAGERIVMINAWNEWAEGAKLEPDFRHGHAYLHATRQALEAADPTGDGSGP